MRMVLLLLFLAISTASAQGETALSVDLVTKGFSDFTTGMAVIAAIVAFARQHIGFVKKLEGVLVVVFSAALGLVLFGLGGFITPVTVAPFSSWGVLGNFAYGLAVALSASGFVDLVKGVLGLVSGNAKPAGTTAADAARSRLR